MATGDQEDFVARLRMTLPLHWFPDTAPVLDVVLNGAAAACAFVYGLIQYARLQTRILTATDGWLDLISADFFGLALPRASGESDDKFRARIRHEMFRPRATRPALIEAVEDLTGRAPIIFEPARPADVGCYGSLGGGLASCLSTIGFGLAGAYGSLSLPYQAFVRVFPALSAGIPSVAGYGLQAYPGATSGGAGGYGAGAVEYADLSMVIGQLTPADIYAAIDAVRPVGATLWVRIETTLPLPLDETLDIGTSDGHPLS